MKRFMFIGDEILQRHGIFTVEAENVQQALEKIIWGQCKFDPQEHRGAQRSTANLSLYQETEIEGEASGS